MIPQLVLTVDTNQRTHDHVSSLQTIENLIEREYPPVQEVTHNERVVWAGSWSGVDVEFRIAAVDACVEGVAALRGFVLVFVFPEGVSACPR